MFRSFRKKPVKEPVEETVRKTSLPDIASQDVQWPEDLVDIAAIRHTPPPEPQLQGAAPISFRPDEPGTTSFHKPFRRFLGCWRPRYWQDLPLAPSARHGRHLPHRHRGTTRVIRPPYARRRQDYPSHPIRYHRY